MLIIELLSRFFQVLGSFLGSNSLATFIIFAVMIYVLYKLLRFTFKVFIVVIAGFLFPFVMNFIFNAGIPITWGSLTFYAMSAAILFIIASAAQKLSWFMSKINSGINSLYERSNVKRMKTEIEEDLKERIENMLKEEEES